MFNTYTIWEITKTDRLELDSTDFWLKALDLAKYYSANGLLTSTFLVRDNIRNKWYNRNGKPVDGPE